MDKPTVRMERQLQLSYEAAQDSIDAYVGGLSAALRAAEQATPSPDYRISDIKRRLLEAGDARRDLNVHADECDYLWMIDKRYSEKKADFECGLIVFAGDIDIATAMAARVLQN